MNIIQSVDKGSPAEAAGIRIGDNLLRINGNVIKDVLDYKFYSYDPELVILVNRDNSEISVKVSKPEGLDLGLNFETYLMDKAHHCANKCIFCFVDQMPRGMRKTLYFKDDDARLSFLLGNYITLTNLSEREIERICKLHVSPINISVHATDPEVRCQMLGNRRAGDCFDIMKRFAESNIRMNCQIVSCPGINDGDVLIQSMKDLSSLYPQVNSVSIVPVGITKFREGLYPLEPYTKESAAAVIELVETFAAKCLEKYESSIFWCSDEFYLTAEREMPEDEYYENYSQLENGVGMLRLLDVEAKAAAYDLSEVAAIEPFTLACGVGVANFMQYILDKYIGKYFPGTYHVYPIENDFFGHTINVSGLVTGRDLINQLRGKDLSSRLLISSNMLRHGENVFLDDVSTDEVERELNVKLISVTQDGGELIDTIVGENYNETVTDITHYDDEFYRYNQKGE